MRSFPATPSLAALLLVALTGACAHRAPAPVLAPPPEPPPVVQAPVVPAPPPEPERHFLWRVRSKSGVAYVLGSVHVGTPQLYPLAEPIQAAYAESGVVAVEADVENADPAALQAKILKAATYEKGKLSTSVSAETYSVAADALLSMGIDPSSVDRFRPWFVAMNITMMAIRRAGLDPEHGIDRHFILRAKTDGKKIVEVEGADLQFRVFSSLTPKEQEGLLLGTVLSLPLIDAELGALLRAWKKGDPAKLDELLRKGASDSPEAASAYDRLLVRRNPGMAAKIEGYLKAKQTHFVIVGAGHLVGAGSVIELLQKKGYSVEQL